MTLFYCSFATVVLYDGCSLVKGIFCEQILRRGKASRLQTPNVIFCIPHVHVIFIAGRY